MNFLQNLSKDFLLKVANFVLLGEKLAKGIVEKAQKLLANLSHDCEFASTEFQCLYLDSLCGKKLELYGNISVLLALVVFLHFQGFKWIAENCFTGYSQGRTAPLEAIYAYQITLLIL